MAVSPQPALYPTGNDAATSAAIALLIHYFDLAPASAQLLVKKWLTNYPAIWVRAAVTEALYQGRYKPFSVEQILAFWQRRGKSIPHFNKEFETIIAVPLQGSFKTETDVAIEGHDDLTSSTAAAAVTAAGDPQAIGAEPALAPSTTLAEALEAAEQDQYQSDDDIPLPRPRLMLPGELPGKGLAQQATVANTDAEDSAARAAQDPSVPALQRPVSPALSQPQGFDGVLDPRPRPQVTQGPDPAMVAEAKSKQIQPPPIGRFTPAVDPSGFASRLKTVVEQAIAKTKSDEEQLSLETAIASQLANDPVLGKPTDETPAEVDVDEASQPTVEAITETEEQTVQPQKTTELEEISPVEAKVVEEESTALAETAELATETAVSLDLHPEEAIEPDTDITTEDNAPEEASSRAKVEAKELDATADPAVSSETEAIAAIAPLEELPAIPQEELPEPDQPEALEPSSEPELSEAEPTEAVAENLAPPQSEVAIAEQPEASSETSLEATPELAAPFEDRFPLTNATETPSETADSSKDAIDIELDSRLIETRLDEEPEISLTPIDNDRLDLVFEAEPELQPEPEARNRFQEAVEADEAALLALGRGGKLLNGDDLVRHLASGLDDDLAFDETGNVIETNGERAETANTPAESDEPLESAPPIETEATTQDSASSELDPPEIPPTIPQPAITAEPLADSTREMSQVSNLLAGLTQLNNANLYPELSLPSIHAMEADPSAGGSDDTTSDDSQE